MYSEKIVSPPEQHQQQLYPGFHLPMSPAFALPSIQSHLPLSPIRSGRLVAPQSVCTDCFLYPPSKVCLQHHNVEAAPARAAYEDIFSHLMLCLQLCLRLGSASQSATPCQNRLLTTSHNFGATISAAVVLDTSHFERGGGTEESDV